MVHFTSSFPWISFKRREDVEPRQSSAEPLREFVYLDEVSLASLLTSQTGELTENVTAQTTEGMNAEAGTKIGVTGPLIPSAETSSRFQTSNSSSLQTVRKANAQSLFRELHRLESLRRISPVKFDSPANSFTELFHEPFSGAVFNASALKRGDLVEFQVRLSASWIFQMSTMVAEFSDIFDESPALFVEHVKFSDIYQAKNANKVISRLLAGLIPVDGLVPDYSVVVDNGEEYIVHNDAVSTLELEKMPLKIVGVTEHLAYSKDIRRVLFANNEFTMLCRLSRPGLQRKWNPIKVADIFKEFAPDLAHQIEVSSRIAMAQSSQAENAEAAEPNVMRLMLALAKYKDLSLKALGQRVSKAKAREIDALMTGMTIDALSAEGQRAAFAQVKKIIEGVIDKVIDSEADFALRQQIREQFDLPLFPHVSDKKQVGEIAQLGPTIDQESRLLDVEVVAIYW